MPIGQAMHATAAGGTGRPAIALTFESLAKVATTTWGYGRHSGRKVREFCDWLNAMNADYNRACDGIEAAIEAARDRHDAAFDWTPIKEAIQIAILSINPDRRYPVVYGIDWGINPDTGRYQNWAMDAIERRAGVISREEIEEMVIFVNAIAENRVTPPARPGVAIVAARAHAISPGTGDTGIEMVSASAPGGTGE